MSFLSSCWKESDAGGLEFSLGNVMSILRRQGINFSFTYGNYSFFQND